MANIPSWLGGISAFTADSIEKQGITSLTDIGKFVPNINVTGFSAGLNGNPMTISQCWLPWMVIKAEAVCAPIPQRQKRKRSKVFPGARDSLLAIPGFR
jgi:hypothetical protein